MRENVNTILLSVSTALATLCWLTFANPVTTSVSEKTTEVTSIESFDRVTGDEPYVGEITMFAGNFPPRNWAFCDGQALAIENHQKLFSLLGTTYGGDGRTYFNLPDLRGRTPVHAGQGSGLERIRLGERYGIETNTPIWSITGIKTATDGTDISVMDDQQNPINREQPSLGINYIIALDGLWPPRS